MEEITLLNLKKKKKEFKKPTCSAGRTGIFIDFCDGIMKPSDIVRVYGKNTKSVVLK